MKEWTLYFSENGEEYVGYLVVNAKRLKKLDRQTVLADEVLITIDEYFTEIRPDPDA